MNWMANSKNRVQKRRSKTNLQRGYFARNTTLPPVPPRRELVMRPESNMSQPEEKFGFRTSKCESKPFSNSNPSYSSNKDPAYSLPRIGSSKGFPTMVPGTPKPFQSTPTSNSVQQTDASASKMQKAYSEKRRKTNDFDAGEYFHANDDLLKTIDHLMKIISEQKKQIKLLEERCNRYADEPCAGRRLQHIDSGGPPSFQGSVEQSPDRSICKYLDGISDNRDQVYSIPKCDDSQVAIKICAGAISCVNRSNNRANNTFNVMENYYIGIDTSRKLLFLHCSLDKRALTESHTSQVQMQDYREMNSIQQAVLNLQQDMPLLKPLRLPTMSCVELANE